MASSRYGKHLWESTVWDIHSLGCFWIISCSACFIPLAVYIAICYACLCKKPCSLQVKTERLQLWVDKIKIIHKKEYIINLMSRYRLHIFFTCIKIHKFIYIYIYIYCILRQHVPTHMSLWFFSTHFCYIVVRHLVSCVFNDWKSTGYVLDLRRSLGPVFYGLLSMRVQGESGVAIDWIFMNHEDESWIDFHKFMCFKRKVFWHLGGNFCFWSDWLTICHVWNSRNFHTFVPRLVPVGCFTTPHFTFEGHECLTSDDSSLVVLRLFEDVPGGNSMGKRSGSMG